MIIYQNPIHQITPIYTKKNHVLVIGDFDFITDEFGERGTPSHLGHKAKCLLRNHFKNNCVLIMYQLGCVWFGIKMREKFS